MGLHPQQRTGLVRGGRGPLGQPREADSTRDQLHVGLDRLALGVADGVLHADPQVTAGRQARQDHRDRRAADAGGRERGAHRQVAQAGDQGFGGTGHAAGYTHDEVDVDVLAVRQAVLVEQPAQRGELAEVEDLVLGHDAPVAHPGVQLDDELPAVEEDAVAEVDGTHRAGRHVRLGVEHAQPVGLGVGDRAPGRELHDQAGLLAERRDRVAQPAEVERRLGGVVADVDVDHAGADRLALTGRGDEFVEGDRKGGYVRLGGLRTGRCHRDQRRCRHGRDPATAAFSPASGLGLVRTDKSLYGFCMGRRRWISVLAGAVLVAGAVGFVAWPAKAAGGVTGTFSKDSDWGSGYQAKYTITNGGTAAISSWTVTFDLPSGLTLGSYWDATATSSGQHVTAKNREYNGSIAPGASASFGFLVGGGSGVPTGCTVNGGSCAGGGGGGGDTTPPSVPGNLRSTGVTSSSVSLAWNASTDNVGVTGYDVFVGGSAALTVTGTSATVNGLSASTTYSFTVKAHDAAGNSSGASNAVSATTSSGGGGGGGGGGGTPFPPPYNRKGPWPTPGLSGNSSASRAEDFPLAFRHSARGQAR